MQHRSSTLLIMPIVAIVTIVKSQIVIGWLSIALQMLSMYQESSPVDLKSTETSVEQELECPVDPSQPCYYHE